MADTIKSRLETQATRVPAGRFLALGEVEAGLGFGADHVRRWQNGRTLSDEDRAIADDIAAALAATGALPFPWTEQSRHVLRTRPEDAALDYLIYRYKFELYPRRRQVADFPVYLLVEPTSACNLRCVMCFQCDRSFTRKPFMGTMDIGLYRDVIDQAVAGGTRALTLASRGEPALHPHLPEMLDYAAGKFLDLKLNTNATRLDERLCHAILDSGVDQLVFSVDSHDAARYGAIRVGGDFAAVVANVRRFQDIRSRHPGARTETRVSGVYFLPDQQEEDFRAFWRDLVDQVGYVQALKRWNTYENDPTPDRIHPCHYLWERLYVWWDGTTNPCDADYKSRLSPGRVGKASIRDIWHGEALTGLRAAHRDGRRAAFVPCDRCGI